MYRDLKFLLSAWAFMLAGPASVMVAYWAGFRVGVLQMMGG